MIHSLVRNSARSRRLAGSTLRPPEQADGSPALGTSHPRDLMPCGVGRGKQRHPATDRQRLLCHCSRAWIEHLQRPATLGLPVIHKQDRIRNACPTCQRMHGPVQMSGQQSPWGMGMQPGPMQIEIRETVIRHPQQFDHWQLQQLRHRQLGRCRQAVGIFGGEFVRRVIPVPMPVRPVVPWPRGGDSVQQRRWNYSINGFDQIHSSPRNTMPHASTAPSSRCHSRPYRPKNAIHSSRDFRLQCPHSASNASACGVLVK